MNRAAVITVSIIASGLLVWALVPSNPYVFYIFLRWIVCGICVFLAFQFAQQKGAFLLGYGSNLVWAALCGFIGIVTLQFAYKTYCFARAYRSAKNQFHEWIRIEERIEKQVDKYDELCPAEYFLLGWCCAPSHNTPADRRRAFLEVWPLVIIARWLDAKCQIIRPRSCEGQLTIDLSHCTIVARHLIKNRLVEHARNAIETGVGGMVLEFCGDDCHLVYPEYDKITRDHLPGYLQEMLRDMEHRGVLIGQGTRILGDTQGESTI